MVKIRWEDRPKALVGLFYASKVVGLGAVTHGRKKHLTEIQAEEILRHTGGFIDYLFGRPIKVDFWPKHSQSGDDIFLDFRLFGRDHGVGAGERAVLEILTEPPEATLARLGG